MKKRLLVTMLATAVVATMLTGCGGKLSEEQGTSTEAQTTIEQTAEPSGGETEVTATIEEAEPVAKFQNGEPYSTRYLDILEPTDGDLLHTGARYFGMDNYGYDNHMGLADKDFLQMGFIDWERQGSVTVEDGVETGGVSICLKNSFLEKGYKKTVVKAFPQKFISQGSRSQILEYCKTKYLCYI